VSNSKRLVFLYLAVFALFAFILGLDAGRWQHGQADKAGILIHAFAALVFGLVLIRQILTAKDI
jgi:hypothetical protein